MKLRYVAVALSAVASWHGAASAQAFTSDSTITVSMSVTDVGGNNNGVLEPGESALVRMGVSFTNQGTLGSYAPNPTGSGTILGFGLAGFDIDVSGGPAANWNVSIPQGYGIRAAGFSNLGVVGTPTGPNLVNVLATQFPGSPQSVNTTTPIPTLWQALWTPTSFANQTIDFSLVGNPTFASASPFELLFDDNNGASLFVGTQGNGIILPGTIPITMVVPGPAGTAVLGLLLVRRRRR